MKKKALPITKIAENTYLIDEFDGTNCYLVAGEEKALLIDSGTGFTEMRIAAERLCGKPVLLLATHGHVDHVGGAGQFQKMYIHRDDTGFLLKLQMTKAARRLFLASNAAIKTHGFRASDITKNDYKTEIIPIDSQFSLELGNRRITVQHTPGHTKGSIAVIDEKEKLIFSGDNVCDALWLHLTGSTTVEEWLPSAKWLYEKSREYRIFWGHRTPQLQPQYIAQVIQWGEEILNTQKNTLLPHVRQYPKQSDGIVYNTKRIHKRGK